MINLFPDQQDVLNQVISLMPRHKRILLQSAPGSGKTVIAGEMASRCVRKGGSVYFICHRQELVDQTAGTFAGFNFNYLSFVASGYPFNPKCPIQICSIDTLKNRIDGLPEPKMAIWDEAHHCGAAGWTAVQNIWQNAWHVGLSGTPERLDGKGLINNFDAMVLGKSVAELIAMERLSNYRYFAPDPPELNDLHSRYGDWIKSELEGAMDKPTITGDIIDIWKRNALGNRTIVFCVSVKHSHHMAEQFRQAGIMAVHLDGTTPKAERRAAAKSFAVGDIQVICNVDLFGEGYDLSAQSGLPVTVEAVVLARPTQSLALHLQQVMRCMRVKKDGSRGIILDHVGAWTRHGFPDDDREWTLQGHQRTGRQSDPEKPIGTRRCPNPKCFCLHRAHLKICPECGHVYEIEGREVDHVAGNLSEINPDQLRNQARIAQASAKDVESLMKLGYSESRARHVIDARREKSYLRTELYNLWQSAFNTGIVATGPNKTAINELKPKELREKIATITGMIQGKACA